MIHDQFASVDGLWEWTIRNLLNQAVPEDSRDGATIEMLGYAARLLHPNRNFLTNPVRDLSPAYAAAETLWYLSGDERGDMIRTYAPSYERFLEEDGTAYGAYGPRIVKNMPHVIKTLRTTPRTRQAVIPIWEHEICEKVTEENATRDVPCTVALQYVARRGHLHATTFMRSNDAWLGLPYDVFAFTCIQMLVAAELDLAVGSYTHFVTSMHLYRRDVDRARKAVENRYPMTPSHGWNCRSTWRQAANAVNVERDGREFMKKTRLYAGDMLTDLVRCCLRKSRPDLEFVEPMSPVLRSMEK